MPRNYVEDALIAEARGNQAAARGDLYTAGCAFFGADGLWRLAGGESNRQRAVANFDASAWCQRTAEQAFTAEGGGVP